MPTQPSVMARIRSQLNEGTARFFPDNDLIGWYSDGAVQQHRVAVEMARANGLLKDISHPYLKKYGKIGHLNVTAGTSFYALPADFLREMHVTLMDASGLLEHDCISYTGGEDWMTENLPHLRPTYSRPAYAFRMNPATNLAAIKLFAFGIDGVPNAAGVLRIYYIRDIVRISTYEAAANAIPVDVDDPYNEGPIWYAVGQATLKRGLDPGGYLSLADRCAQNIFGPMAAAAATAAKAEGDGSSAAVASGISRDGS